MPGHAPEPFEVVHATAIAVENRAALIIGPSGAGKSDLALRCLAASPNALVPAAAGLVSDDRTALRRSDTTDAGTHLEASAPAALRGRIEVRGLGIFAVPAVPRATVVLAVKLTAEMPERLPDLPLPTTEFLGVPVATLQIRPFEASAPLKLLLALAQHRRFAQPPPDC